MHGDGRDTHSRLVGHVAPRANKAPARSSPSARAGGRLVLAAPPGGFVACQGLTVVPFLVVPGAYQVLLVQVLPVDQDQEATGP